MHLDEGDECEVILDENCSNEGRPEGNFYQQLDFRLEEYGKAAEERRKKELAHVPVAVSIPQLIKTVCFSVLYMIKVKTCKFFSNQLYSKGKSLLTLLILLKCKSNILSLFYYPRLGSILN